MDYDRQPPGRILQRSGQLVRADGARCFAVVDPDMVRALLEELGDLAAGLDLADPEQRAVFYQEMGISALYQPANRIVLLTAEPDLRRRTVRVAGLIHEYAQVA